MRGIRSHTKKEGSLLYCIYFFPPTFRKKGGGGMGERERGNLLISHNFEERSFIRLRWSPLKWNRVVEEERCQRA